MSLNLLIENEFDNRLLNRKQINFKILHQKMPTPTRKEVRKKIAAQFNVSLESVFISNLTSKYGRGFTVGYAKIYDSLEKALQIESKYILKRNQIKNEKKSKK